MNSLARRIRQLEEQLSNQSSKTVYAVFGKIEDVPDGLPAPVKVYIQVSPEDWDEQAATTTVQADVNL